MALDLLTFDFKGHFYIFLLMQMKLLLLLEVNKYTKYILKSVKVAQLLE